MCNCDDAQQTSGECHADAGKPCGTGANSSRPDTCSMDVPQYEELLQCIKRQENEIAQRENEIAQLRQAYQQQPNIFFGAAKYSQRSNKLPIDSGLQCAPVLGKVSRQARSDLRQCAQKAQTPDFNENRQRPDRRHARKCPDDSSQSGTDFSDNKSTSESDSDTQKQRTGGCGVRIASDNYGRSHRRRDKTYRRRRDREKNVWIKPEKFNGHGCFETFLAQFENCSSYNRWNNSDKAAHLRWSLTGAAAQLLWAAEGLTCKELLEKLRCRYSGKGMEERFQTELRCRRRHREESLRELAQDIRRLMTLAYPGEKSTFAEHIARDVFLTALNDPEFELKIREREPVDLDEALKLAQRFEVFKSAVQSSSRDRSSRHIADMGNEETLTTVETRLAALEAEFRKSRTRNGATVQPAVGSEATQQAAEKQVDALNKEVGRLRHLEQLRNLNPGCAVGQSGGGQAKKFFSKKTCHRCGQPGHFIRNCPQPEQVEHGGPFAEQLDERGQAGLSCRMCAKKPQSSTADAVYLDLYINGRSCECLLDTGSDVTLVPAKYVDSVEVKDTNHALMAANGTRIAVSGEVTLPFTLGKYQGVIEGLVTEDVAEIILGIGWLVRHCTVWEFNRSRVKIGGTYHKLKRHLSVGAWCRRVVAQQDVIIPSRSEADLATKVVFKKLSDVRERGDVAWTTEPTRVTDGVYASWTVIPDDRFDNIPVRVMNVKQEPIIVRAGVSVADLQPVNVLGSMQVGDSAAQQEGVSVVESSGEKERLGFIDGLIGGMHEPFQTASGRQQ